MEKDNSWYRDRSRRRRRRRRKDSLTSYYRGAQTQEWQKDGSTGLADTWHAKVRR